MSRRNYGKDKFNGEGVEEFEMFAEEFHVEAAKRGCDHHFRWTDEEVGEDNSVPEEEFVLTRPCPIGQEEATCLANKEANIAELNERRERQLAAINAGFTVAARRAEERTKLIVKCEDELGALNKGFLKTVMEMRSACDLHDKNEKLFLEQRAQAMSLLNQWLGPNPYNKIHNVLVDIGPKNAWKVLVDSYEAEASTDLYLNTVQTKMDTLVFSKGMGKVADHMAYLDRLNTPFVKLRRPVADGQLMNYLYKAIKRSKDAQHIYGKAIDHIFMAGVTRIPALELLTRVEHEHESKAEINGDRPNTAGAQFAHAKAYAGTASAQQNKKKRRAEDGGHSSGGAPAKKTATGSRKKYCIKCGGPHWKKDCTETVFCKSCNVDTHSEGTCFKLHPELIPAEFKKRKVGKSA